MMRLVNLHLFMTILVYQQGTFIHTLKISQEGENPTITFFVKREDETAHCVAFVGSKLYNNNWNDPNSVIYIMDPGYSDIKSYTLSELYTYNAIYCK